MKYLIVGAGFGGLAAAALLAKAGHEVTVLEKNEQPGGRARLETHKGFTYDMGPSWYLMPEVFEKLFKQLGTSSKKELELIKLDPGYSLFFGTEKLSVGTKAQTKKLFESLEPGAGKQLEKYLAQAKYQYEVAMEEFIYKEYTRLRDFFTVRLLKEALSLNMFSSLHGYVKKQFSDHRLQKILEYAMVFLGGSPKNTPALYSLMSHVDITSGVYYPMGGLHQVAVVLENLAKKHGATFVYNANVEQILVENKTAMGVRYNKNKEERAERVIINADYAFAQLELLEKKHRSYSSRYWKSRTIAPSAFIMYLGVEKKLPKLNHHNLFIADNWEVHFKEIFDKPQWPTNPSYYVCNPNKTEKNMAPRGHENLFFLVPVAPGLKDTPTMRDIIKTMVLADFEKKVGVPIRDHIVFEKTFAHNDFSSLYNAYQGTALGLTHTMRQTAIFRPKHKDKKIANLYYTGHYTHPGVGVPMVLISSQILVRELL